MSDDEPIRAEDAMQDGRLPADWDGRSVYCYVRWVSREELERLYPDPSGRE